MESGTVLLIAGKDIGVLVQYGEETSKVMTYFPRTGRWSSPRDTANSVLSIPPDDNLVVIKAKANIKRHFGVIPYGGVGTQRARVWRLGKEPGSE